MEPGICLLFISSLEARQFFFAGSETEIPPRGGLQMPANKLFVVLALRERETQSFVCSILGFSKAVLRFGV